MNKSVKIGNMVNLVLSVIAGTYLIIALLTVFGMMDILPIFGYGGGIFAGAVLATAKGTTGGRGGNGGDGLGAIFPGAVLATAKGAEKVVKYKIEHILNEAATKGGKKAFALSLPRESANDVKNEINALLAFCGASLFSWPTQNPDKERYITYGFMPNAHFVVTNYLQTGNLDMVGAKKHGETLRAEKEEAKEAKKATKESKGSPLAAKIQALRDMRDAGEITPEQYSEKALALIG